MKRNPKSERAAVQLSDVILTLATLVATVVLAPTYYEFIDMASSSADPFTGLALQLMPPLLVLALVVSVGVSGRRGS